MNIRKHHQRIEQSRRPVIVHDQINQVVARDYRSIPEQSEHWHRRLACSSVIAAVLIDKAPEAGYAIFSAAKSQYAESCLPPTEQWRTLTD
jgi:hypothetical protein